MKPLQASGFGIVVDKSKATKTFPMNTPPSSRASRWNHVRQPIPQENEDCIGKIGAIILFILSITLLFL